MGLVSNEIVIPSRTYMSILMTLKLFGFDVHLDKSSKWSQFYEIIDNKTICGTGVFDCAVFFKRDMFNEITGINKLLCVSFQQKKRLNLGRGGAILTDNQQYYKILKRMVYDGRNSKISDMEEVCSKPNDIFFGFHCYLEPEKAAKGINILNQPSIMRDYVVITSDNYPNLSNIQYRVFP